MIIYFEYLLLFGGRLKVTPACQHFSLSDGTLTCRPRNNNGTLLMNTSLEYISRIFVWNISEKWVFKKVSYLLIARKFLSNIF